MKIDIKVNKTIEVDIDIEDLIFEINEKEPIERAKIIAHIFNEIDKDCFAAFTEDQAKVIKKWFENQIERFKHIN